MEVYSNYLIFLNKIGIVPQTKLPQLLQNKNNITKENDILSFIAKFLEDLDPSQYYDISANLFKFFSDMTSESFESQQHIPNASKKNCSKDKINNLGISIVKKNNNELKNDKNDEEKHTPSVHSKLYSDFLSKTEAKAFINENKQEKLDKECTFIPEINNKSILNNSKLNVPVFERLTNQTSKLDETEKNILKLKEELQGCTFRPHVLDYLKNKSNENIDPFIRLYDNAGILQESLKEKRLNSERKKNEEFTRSPSINKESQIIMQKKKELDASTHSAHERLYSNFKEKQNYISQKQFEKTVNETRHCTFNPNTSFTFEYQKKSKILEKRINDPSIFDRLYKSTEKLKVESPSPRKPIQNNQKKDGVKANTPVFNKLYNEMFQKKKKAENLVNNYMNEIGATFKPNLNKKEREGERKFLKARSEKNLSSERGKDSARKKNENPNFLDEIDDIALKLL